MNSEAADEVAQMVKDLAQRVRLDMDQIPYDMAVRVMQNLLTAIEESADKVRAAKALLAIVEANTEHIRYKSEHSGLAHLERRRRLMTKISTALAKLGAEQVVS